MKRLVCSLVVLALSLGGCVTGGTVDVKKVMDNVLCAQALLAAGIVTAEQAKELGDQPDALQIAKLAQGVAVSPMAGNTLQACAGAIQNAADAAAKLAPKTK